MTRTALVTGASGGIGRELATLFARDGHDLVVVARSEEELIELGNRLQNDYGVTVTVVVKDLADPDSPAEIQSALDDRGVDVDILVNNAGFATYGRFLDTDLDTERDELQVNVLAVTELTKRFLPGMVERGEGRVLNVASTAAFQPGPLMAVYYASKAYVLSFSEALTAELDETGVTVTALCPGPTDTGFQSRADMGASKLVQGELQDPAEVARAGYRGMQEGEAVVVPGLRNKLLTVAVRLLPRSVVRSMVKRAQAPTSE
ncbi:SDR family NAD(P)-dependent oxidoreductase [Salinirubrum litoreum]|uniref:SDR family NAD(P)-dependent oxidoreductase n=1 Tax=Salinirubrum litoreum TaxID=1126234 RepID=A0ABD5RCA1_9EURY|nr:SDR family oxidoreductase [Salinirubrum litoreum]